MIQARSLPFVAATLFGVATCIAGVAESETELIERAQSALRTGKLDEAQKLVDEATAADDKNFAAWELSGRVLSAMGEHAKAAAALKRAAALNPDAASVLDALGSEQFMAGDVKGSIESFDAYLKLRPEEARQHWKRGISYYYAERFDEGRKQFESYQTFDASDVENAVWRYLCMARSDGVEKARQAILPIKDDRRVPMREVYELFAGRAKTDDVLRAASAGDPPAERQSAQLFYAHLYVGLHHEAQGDSRLALEHITRAAEKHRIGHYMWDVARVHVELRKKQAADDRGAKP